MRRLGRFCPLRVWLPVVICNLSLQFAQAGDRSNIVGLGMGRTSTVTSRGVDALGINPANLAVMESKSFTLSFLPVGARVGTDFLDYGTYRRYLTGVSTDSGRVGYFLTDRDKEQILSGFSTDMGTINGDVDIKLISLSFQDSSFGGIGIGIRERVGARGVLSKDYLRFLFYGNSPGESFNFSSTEIRGWWLREYSVSYARAFENAFGLNSLAVGVGAKLINGFGYFDLQQVNTSFTTSSQNVVAGHAEYLSHRAGVDFFSGERASSFTAFPSPSGKGWGFDFGINAKVNSFMSFGLSVTDVGTLRWTHNARERRANGNFTIDDAFSESQQDSLQNLVEGTDQKVDAFETQLPTAIHAGLSLQLGQSEFAQSSPPILLAFDYTQGLNNMPGNSRQPRFSLGMEFRLLSWLPLRSGISVGGSEQRSWAFGLGLHLGPFALDVATEDVLSVLQPNQASRVSLGIGTRWSF